MRWMSTSCIQQSSVYTVFLDNAHNSPVEVGVAEVQVDAELGYQPSPLFLPPAPRPHPVG